MKNRLLKTFTSLVLTVLMVISVMPAFAITIGAVGEQTYVKVTTAPDDWSGTYLIVYETGNVAFNGSLSKLDAVSNTVSVTITDGKITGDFSANIFTIAKSVNNGKYTIQSKFGYYIGQTTGGNGLKSSTSDTYDNTISLNDDGTVNIVSGGAYLRYNATSGQERFRYYKSSSYTNQKAITLYKLVETAGGGSTEGSGSETTTETPSCEHDWKLTSSNAATCTEAGYDEYTCSKCDATEQKTTDAALGHDEIPHDAKAATCTAVGWEAYVTCSRCDYTTYVEIPKAAHTYENGLCTVCSAKMPTYVKVTTAPTNWSGEYLIVYEAGSVAFDGSLTTLDAVSNTVKVTISDNTIAGDLSTKTFTIEKSGDNYIIKSASGYYIGQTSDANGLTASNSNAYTNSFSLDGDGNINIVSSGGAFLRFNATSNQLRFRYYKSTSYSSQQAITLYKLADDSGNGSESTTPETEPTIKTFSLSLNEGVTVKVTFDIPEAWLTANEGAKVVFNNGEKDIETIDVVADENVYSVDLTPAQINDALTVKITSKDGSTIFLDEKDVSVSTYKDKAKDAGKSTELIALLNAALTYSNAADGTGENLTNGFEGVADHSYAGELFTAFSGQLGTDASIYINVDTGKVPESGGTLVLKVGTGENEKVIINGNIADYITKDHRIVITGLYPATFNDTISIDTTIEGSKATFTFNSYLKAIYNDNSSTQQVKNLAVATYLYGLKAEEYLATLK